MSGAFAGAIAGLLVGVALSLSVARTDARKRAEGERTRAEYTASLVVVPALLALIGGLVGAAIAH